VIKLAASGLVAFDPADTLAYTFIETQSAQRGKDQT
jgi:hypothetical protein